MDGLSHSYMMSCGVLSAVSLVLGMWSAVRHATVLWWTLPLLVYWLRAVQAMVVYFLVEMVNPTLAQSVSFRDALGDVAWCISVLETILWLLWVIRTRRRLSCAP